RELSNSHPVAHQCRAAHALGRARAVRAGGDEHPDPGVEFHRRGGLPGHRHRARHPELRSMHALQSASELYRHAIRVCERGDQRRIDLTLVQAFHPKKETSMSIKAVKRLEELLASRTNAAAADRKSVV